MQTNKDNNQPYVIVLILSYNGKPLLEEAVPSYLANDYQNFEVVVIDNGSIDGTKEYVEQNWENVRIFRTEKNLGYAGGFNYGLKQLFSRMDVNYILISNNDVKADKHLISELVSAAQKNPEAGFVVGKTYIYDKPDVLQTVGKKYDEIRWNGEHIGANEKDKGQYDKDEERYFADDVYALVTKELYKSVGGYDPDFKFQSEETDWQARAKLKGFKIIYAHKAKLWHKVSMTIGKNSAFKMYYDIRSPIMLIAKHKNADYFQSFFWCFFKKNILISSLKQLYHLNLKKAINLWLGMFSGLKYGFRHKYINLKSFF